MQRFIKYEKDYVCYTNRKSYGQSRYSKEQKYVKER